MPIYPGTEKVRISTYSSTAFYAPYTHFYAPCTGWVFGTGSERTFSVQNTYLGPISKIPQKHPKNQKKHLK